MEPQDPESWLLDAKGPDPDPDPDPDPIDEVSQQTVFSFSLQSR